MPDASSDGIAGLGSLHDLELVEIRLRWPTAEALLELADHDGSELIVRVAGLKRTEMTRELPWGDSRFVNEATVVRLSEGECRLLLEMQGGDSISVVGSHVDYLGSRADLPDPSALPLR